MARPKKEAASSPKKTKSPKKEKAIKKKKDPNAPKRGSSAYLLWLNENRPNFAKKGMNVAEVAKIASVEWKKVTDKSKWEKQAGEDKKRYEKELAAYKADNERGSPQKATASNGKSK